MKKALKIFGIALGVILILLILIPVLFKGRIESAVKDKVNESVNARVEWSRFSLSLFRGFPDLSINLHQLSVVGVDEFEGDTLLGLQRFELRANPFSAFRKDIEVKSIILDRPLVNAMVLEDGRANWDIAIAGEAEEEVPEEEAEEGGGSAMSLSLELFSIRDGRIFYEDVPMGVKAGMEDFDLSLAGDFAMDETVLDLVINIGEINAVYGGVRYMRNGTFGLDLKAAAHMLEQRYSMLENEIRINGLVLGVEGDVQMLENGGMDMALDFFSRETSFCTLLSMVPAIYLQGFESLETRGSLELKGRVEGVMIDSLMPDANIELLVRDGFFSYPDLPKDVSDVQIAMQARYDGENMDNSTVQLDRFHLLLGGNPFDIRMHVAHPLSDMHVAGAMKGLIDFSTLKDVVPLDDMEIGGKLTADLSVDTRMSYIEEERYEEVDLDGQLIIEGVDVEGAELPVPVRLEKLELNFTPRFVDLAGLAMNLGSSDLKLSGQLENFIPYVFEGKTVSGKLSVQSGLLDANELMPAGEEEAEPAEGTESPADTTGVTSEAPAGAEPMKIPENIDFQLDLDLKEVRYEDITVENIRGGMSLKEGVAYLDGLKLEVIEGSVSAEGSVDTRSEETLADLDLDIRNIDIPTAYSSFVVVERLAPVARYCKGNANVSLTLKSALDASFSPVYESINARGRVFTQDVQFYNMKSFVSISQLLNNEKFQNAAPDNMDIRFRISDGRVMVEPFRILVENSKMVISGDHGIDMSLDYRMNMEIAKEDLGQGANQLMAGMNALAAGAGIKLPESDVIKVKARITGTFDDPKLSTDLTGNMGATKKEVKEAVQEAVKEKVVEEVKKVEEEVREDARQKADKIIKDAEEESARIMAEARKAGDDLVKEAEVQGQKLVDEANNPLKKAAAREGKKELVRQAEKKKESLLQEAQRKVDKIMADARAEAERI